MPQGSSAVRPTNGLYLLPLIAGEMAHFTENIVITIPHQSDLDRPVCGLI